MAQGFDMNALFQQAQAIQEQMRRTQEELAKKEVTGTAGGGMVVVTATGTGEISRVQIDPSVVDPKDVVIIAAGHHDRRVAFDADFRRLVAGDDAVAVVRLDVARDDRLLHLPHAVHLLAQPLGQLPRPLGPNGLHRRFEAGQETVRAQLASTRARAAGFWQILNA